jgi:F0F1-type ATP synthase epsilon subunit
VKLTIVSPQHKYEYTVQWIEAQTPAGSLIIQPEHAPIILSLIAGSDLSFAITGTNEQKNIRLVRPGFLEVTRNSAVALVGQDA